MDKPYYYKFGKFVEVSKEVYEALIKSDNKIRYMEKDLKQEKLIVKKDSALIIKPSREDSLERLLDKCHQFADDTVNVEETVITKCMIEQIHECLPLLSEDEQELIKILFFDSKSERQWSAETGIPRKTISYRKQKVLDKLKELLEK